jgi:hypothetical protein
MRRLAVMILILSHGLCEAQQESLASCMDRLAEDSKFAPLAGKLAVGNSAEIPPAGFADASLASDKERRIISDWAAARAECIKASNRYGNELYRAPLQVFGIDAENKVMAAAATLYNRKISFGEFNRQRKEIAEEMRANAADLSRRIQLLRAAQDQEDRQSRERRQMQQEIEEAERQAALARQQAEQAQEARPPARANRPDGPRNYRSARIGPYRGCFRFGSRLACTGW